MSAQKFTTFPLADLVGDLTYDSYIWQRQHHPEIAPERWAKVYGVAETAQMEACYRQQLVGLVDALPRVSVMFARNFDVRCDAVEVTNSGQDNAPECGAPTLRCPGCGEWSGCCEAHLFEQPDGTRVCIECDGAPQFRRMGPDAVDLHSGQAHFANASFDVVIGKAGNA